MEQEELQEKKNKAFNKIKNYIHQGSRYYITQIEKVEQTIETLQTNPKEYFKGKAFSEQNINEEERMLKNKISILYSKQKDIESHMSKVTEAFDKYEENSEKIANSRNLRQGDRNVVEVLNKLGYSSLMNTYEKEYSKINDPAIKSRKQFEGSFEKNIKYILDDKGLQIFEGATDLGKHEFLRMLETENIHYEAHAPIEESSKQLTQEQEVISSTSHEQVTIEKVTDKKNEFNFSKKDLKNIKKCTEINSDIAKHKQILSKLDVLQKRFAGRENEFSKLMSKIEKISEKEELKIEKLNKKMQKPYKSTKIEELSSLVDKRKEVSDKRDCIEKSKEDIQNNKNMVEKFVAEKAELDEKIKSEENITERQSLDVNSLGVVELRPDISSIKERAKMLEQKIAEISLQIVKSEKALETSKIQLTTFQKEQATMEVNLDHFTTKSLFNSKTPEIAVAETKKPDIRDVLSSQVIRPDDEQNKLPPLHREQTKDEPEL